MSDFTELWHCGHTRKCGWVGRATELVEVPAGKGWPETATRSSCPRCGSVTFYIRQQNDPRPVPGKKGISTH